VKWSVTLNPINRNTFGDTGTVTSLRELFAPELVTALGRIGRPSRWHDRQQTHTRTKIAIRIHDLARTQQKRGLRPESVNMLERRSQRAQAVF